MIFAIWDSSTTAILTGIVVGILGAFATAGAALYKTLGAEARQADFERMKLATKACEDRYDRLEVEFRALENAFRESDKRAAIWELRWQIATGNVATTNPPGPSTTPKSGST
jgi:hypothetical protein